MSAKSPKPTKLIRCRFCKKEGTDWYKIADSHKSPTMLSTNPDYWICCCDRHKPYNKLW